MVTDLVRLRGPQNRHSLYLPDQGTDEVPARIVFVHDDPSFREPLVAALNAAGHDVARFADSIAAWDALYAANWIEILVTRVQFGPGKPHGVALANSARARRPDVRVLLLALPQFRNDAKGVGLFIPIPANVPEVAETVERMLADDQLGRGD
jgi:DNA-binding NtrC family response regulator